LAGDSTMTRFFDILSFSYVYDGLNRVQNNKNK